MLVDQLTTDCSQERMTRGIVPAHGSIETDTDLSVASSDERQSVGYTGHSLVARRRDARQVGRRRSIGVLADEHDGGRGVLCVPRPTVNLCTIAPQAATSLGPREEVARIVRRGVCVDDAENRYTVTH